MSAIPQKVKSFFGGIIEWSKKKDKEGVVTKNIYATLKAGSIITVNVEDEDGELDEHSDIFPYAECFMSVRLLEDMEIIIDSPARVEAIPELLGK